MLKSKQINNVHPSNHSSKLQLKRVSTPISENDSYEDDFEEDDFEEEEQKEEDLDSSEEDEPNRSTTPPRSDPSFRSWQVIDFNSDIRLNRQIGGGGVGVVYQGWYKNEEVAVKTYFDPKITPELQRNFMDELNMMSKIHHPNIIEFIGSSTTPPNLCFVMEICKCSLFDMLHKDHVINLSEKDRLRICLEVARGMHYLHSFEPCIIHRDLKPQNILISQSGTVRLCDFGLANSRVIAAGTPNYMAPELFENRFFTSAVDMYSFAVVVWEVFTELIPFYGYDVRDIRLKVCRGDRPDIPLVGGMIPVGCKSMIRDGWSQNPRDRPDFDDIVDQLESLIVDCDSSSDEFAMDVLDDLGGEGDALDDMMKAVSF